MADFKILMTPPDFSDATFVCKDVETKRKIEGLLRYIIKNQGFAGKLLLTESQGETTIKMTTDLAEDEHLLNFIIPFIKIGTHTSKGTALSLTSERIKAGPLQPVQAIYEFVRLAYGKGTKEFFVPVNPEDIKDKDARANFIKARDKVLQLQQPKAQSIFFPSPKTGFGKQRCVTVTRKEDGKLLRSGPLKEEASPPADTSQDQDTDTPSSDPILR